MRRRQRSHFRYSLAVNKDSRSGLRAKPRRVILCVLDSVGIGDAPDAAEFGDAGANTLAHTARAAGGLNVPCLESLGLGHLADIEGVEAVLSPRAAYGRLTEKSPGKDTTTGHWELAGCVLEEPFPLFPEGFPQSLLNDFTAATGYGVLGNKPASGTVIIDELGDEHLRTGRPIVYTSGDSVFQIAAHEESFGLDELYRCCTVARELVDALGVGRVIARPFVGQPGSFQRTSRRRDYSRRPPVPTVLDDLQGAGKTVVGVGKIHDIFAGAGVSQKLPTANNRQGVERTIEAMEALDEGLIFTNLVDFDALYGHRRDPAGYARCLEEFDAQLPHMLDALQPDDLLILTADHGNDPTMPGTDHTRERVPLLVVGSNAAAGVDAAGVNLGTGDTFADIAATLRDVFDLPPSQVGHSLLPKLVGSPSAANVS